MAIAAAPYSKRLSGPSRGKINGQTVRPRDRKPVPAELPRSSGVLLHVTSLPSAFGIGDLGPAAYRWIDDLARAGQTWWQVLPMGPAGEGHSPYSGRSAFAGSRLLISPELLVREGLLSRGDLPTDKFASGRADFDRASAARTKLLQLAYERFSSSPGHALREDYDQFRVAERSWLHDYTLFTALKTKLGEHRTWYDWPRPLLRRDPKALSEAAEELSDELDQLSFQQFLFFRQLDAMRAHAASKGVRLMGDVPIYVSGDSADVWSHPHLFQLNARLRPRRVAGVPPDVFSTTGQRWGNPLYDWEAMNREGYQWWIDRLQHAFRQADYVRIDHFRGLAGYWSIPASAPTAESGRWVTAPGQELLSAVQKALGGLALIAEDLGVITPDVVALRDGFKLPGMQILQFAFGEDNSQSLPHHHTRNAIAYTGTHDNATTAGWVKSLDSASRKRLYNYAPEIKVDPVWGLIRLCWSSVANVAIAPMQDVLSLDDRARMNTPGIGTGNWSWRLSPEAPVRAALGRLGELTKTYGRSNTKESTAKT